ncbi:hypothetical protein SAMN02745911_0748 [Aureimonas altamirensis DSM 21988]|uniref:Reverse transcriptase (RNA-dependent DNA polymerase) n=1 Tax=Aureimonas altamirensis DSM 21988 TaxID=1121026 RepID=A0ABY1I5Z2_9HYPH|nr:RNA-directed DNA polymerase [Aureimonas altamirensis]SHI64703.1 hypothetical protein SAMN02745911_0748 [Aureimonas altamirensis DSM 21988]
MERLKPTLEDVSQEYVLIQAWKKASAWIRYHNWFSDTLELDYATANLPKFLRSIGDELRTGTWTPQPLRLVPAPKSQKWYVAKDGIWKPDDPREVNLRPLAHVSLRDQVAATSLMLCLADRVETLQGDPRPSEDKEKAWSAVISYGNRLFCDPDGVGGLHHRWGSSKLYRSFSIDYRSFIGRPEEIARALDAEGRRVVIVTSDLKQFYDRVRPAMLIEQLDGIRRGEDDPDFYSLAAQVLSWRWHKQDLGEVDEYAEKGIKIPGFRKICLPQGLVPAGFFANLALLNFDRQLAACRKTPIFAGATLRDTSRYVDDVRLVLTVPREISLKEIKDATFSWLQDVLTETSPGLLVSPEKTEAVEFREGNRPLLRQGRKMARIQSAISGGFDAAGGEEIIDAVQSLVRAQEHYTQSRKTAKERLLPVPDVRDTTVARFSAARFRSTFRSLRPLLENSQAAETDADTLADETAFRREGMTRSELDDEARNFAFALVQQWMDDPSNVRLLRIGLDIWPSPHVLKQVLELLRPYLKRTQGQPRLVALYCLSELFKAGATETGFVEDDEYLPSAVDVNEYRAILADEAILVVSTATPTTPWYLRQQALLMLAVTRSRIATQFDDRLRMPETQLYLEFLSFLNRDREPSSYDDFAILAVMARRSVLDENDARQLLVGSIDRGILESIAMRDPAFAAELRPAWILEAPEGSPSDGWVPLVHSLSSRRLDRIDLRNEIGVLSFMHAFAAMMLKEDLPEIIPPSIIEMRVSDDPRHPEVMELRIATEANEAEGFLQVLYQPPSWCEASLRWKFQMGYLARFILTGNLDFTEVRTTSWRETRTIYRQVRSHWFQRSYGLHNGHEGFGDDWLAISQTTEDLLYSMLAWPGCRIEDGEWLKYNHRQLLLFMRDKLRTAKLQVGDATGTLMLPILAPLLTHPHGDRPLRGCVIQTITPEPHEITETDLTLSAPAIRKKHRNHLSTALAAVKKMLDLRATHHKHEKRLDWLILPELAVHPKDIKTHLIRFARDYKTIILAGLAYEVVEPGKAPVNSALWILPQLVAGRGLQVKTRRQGKHHLARMEKDWEDKKLIRGFRPVQWLVGYNWAVNPAADPLWLTSAVCYDATDLRLASDLRDRSDVFAIPALNQDIGTFDQMVAALHYHMYQMVIVANNGSFGGSSAHVPFKETHFKQVFHSHGQPQASISFFEIEDIPAMKDRLNQATKVVSASPVKIKGTWKYPPAGIDVP